MAATKSVTRERVLAAGVALADAEGLGALTMRGVATALGIEAMSLYHHLPGKKEELLDGLIDVVAAEMATQVGAAAETVADPSDGAWVAEVRSRCLAAREVMLRHPWMPRLLGSRTTIRPGVFQLYEDVLGVMVRGGCSYRLAHRAMHALGSMVLGFSQELFGPGGGGEDTSEAETEAMAAALPYTSAMVAAELHDATDPMLGWCDSQTEFEFTLGLLLDGLERARRAEAGRAPASGEPQASTGPSRD
ncbi:TetR/AcrR family transcriptional regulator C-terminal domain-containing protein [Isoptericola halotolerans]|uniref:AcrR family transcriptional regulator n=1 Tax=Isoptericola halotolerans TaxID=300560 RepID=A0ABX2A8E1_9MICO|nr:TetR/AcrR family transcriptional regulator [Isoptericola halotolerans]NOV98891.1 AcrR family transcriptional regulator [Isoptericola halotolerans]